MRLFQEQTNLIPTNEFAVLIENLDKNSNFYSSKSRALANEIKTLLKGGLDAYFESSASISRWCDDAVGSLQSYLSLLGNNEKTLIGTMNDMIIHVFEEGLQKIAEAQQQLEQASRNFNQASGKIIAFTPQLNEDFDPRKTPFFGVAAAVAMSRICFFCGIPASILPNTSIATIASVIAVGLIKMGSYHAELEAALKTADIKIIETKTKLLEEIRVLGEVKTKTQVSLHTMKDVIDIGELDDVLQKEIKIPVSNLIENCRKYREQHSVRKAEYF